MVVVAPRIRTGALYDVGGIIKKEVNLHIPPLHCNLTARWLKPGHNRVFNQRKMILNNQTDPWIDEANIKLLNAPTKAKTSIVKPRLKAKLVPENNQPTN